MNIDAYLQRLHPDRLCIFLFHGVIPRQEYAVRNYTRKHLEQDEFRDLVEALARSGQPMSMEEVAVHCREQRPFPPRAFAVTFDDGFENNFSVAAPLLEHCQVPATFYITTDFVGRNRMSWVDRIEYCFEQCRRVRVLLPWRGAASAETPAEKTALLEEIRFHFKRDAALDVNVWITELFERNELEEVHSADGPLDLKMDWRQIAQLDRHPLFGIGGHTHTHAILSHLAPEQMHREIDMSLEELRSNAGVRTVHYSYPEGLAHCYDERVIAALKQRGIVCCPSAQDGTNSPDTDPFHLRRIAVV